MTILRGSPRYEVLGCETLGVSGSYRREPWRTLEIDETRDRSAIRRAYAAKLKTLDIDREIAAYEQLRQARDYALMLAQEEEAGEYAAPLSPFDDPAVEDDAADEKTAGEQVDQPATSRPVDDKIASIEVVAPSLPGPDDGHVSGEDQPAPHPEQQMGVAQIAASERDKPNPEPAGQPETDAPVADGPEAEAAEEHPTAPQVLLAILYPGQEYSAEPLDHEMFSLACAALNHVLAEAEESAIDQQQAIEEWLAHHLASSWPRSAHLVEHASENFSWLDESGSLSERPAVRFLNERLRGMRFVEKVQQPDHPLRSAWAELSKAGRRRNFLFTRVSKGNVLMLLNGLRERYPEVESYLDPQRVGSWEERLNNGGGSPWKTAGTIIFCFWILIHLINSLTSVDTSKADYAPLAPPITLSDPVITPAERDNIIIKLFGTRVSDETLEAGAPVIWSEIIPRAPDPNANEDAPVSIVSRLRTRIFVAGNEADLDTLIEIKQLRLDLAKLARDRGGSEACRRFLNSHRLPDTMAVPDHIRENERRIAGLLITTSLLDNNGSWSAPQAPIPNRIVDMVMKKTVMTREEFNRAAQKDGSAKQQCDFRIALLEAVLSRPETVSEKLLRMI